MHFYTLRNINPLLQVYLFQLSIVRACVYAYVCVCVCVYLYIYIYILLFMFM